MTSQLKDKDGTVIKEGDTVSGKIRGGKHVGEVDEVTSKEEASEKGVKNPPKVLLTDQHGILPCNTCSSQDTMSKEIPNH